MAVTRTANQPITFSGQIVAYAAGVANTSQSSVIVDTANTPIEFSQHLIQYSPSTDTTVKYTPA